MDSNRQETNQIQMNLRQHPPLPEPQLSDESVYNIIPIRNLRADRPSSGFREVDAAIAALRVVGELRKPPFVPWQPHYDLLDWLGFLFGFQADNVSNQREHLVLQLANARMMSLQTPPDNVDTLDSSVVLVRFRRKLLGNYTDWCSFLGCKPNLWISEKRRGSDDDRRELLYVALYLLIWGESANLRFMPECICYIFHHMAMELNRILEDYIDENTGRPVFPSISGENAFLNRVVKPIYDMVKTEVEDSRNGHSNWRNYDDINEYFWSRRCFDKLKWPIDIRSNFFAATSKEKRVGKTGFVEQRSFLNLFRSFDKLWTMLFLFLQAAIIVAWKDSEDYPWQALRDNDTQAKVLSVFITWSGLRFLQAVLDAVMQYKLVSRETFWLGVRMVLKIVVSTAWIIVFMVFFARIWKQTTDNDRGWSGAASKPMIRAALVFIIPEVLELALLVLPRVGYFFQTSNWRIFHLMTWWFHGSRIFVGQGLREGLSDNVRYSSFWIVVLATKFCFSYLLQIKPMIQPTKDLLHLEDIRYQWPDISNGFTVGLLWLPVVLTYLMDLQIWYSIYSSFAGGGIGLVSHLGEIRNVQQLRLRFPFFAGALQFNLMHRERSLDVRESHFLRFWKDAKHRFQLRYGTDNAIKRFKLDQVNARRFALVWNEIILTFREEDIVSDHEVELLEMPPNTWKIRVVCWPAFLLCNELLVALSRAKKLLDAPDSYLWNKILKNEYRRCAVIEFYDGIRHLLLTIIKGNTQEHSILSTFFREIDDSISIGKFTKTFKMSSLPKIHAKLITLLDLLIQSDKDVNKVAVSLQALYEVVVRDFFVVKRTENQLGEIGLAPHRELLPGDHRLLFENAVEFPDSDNELFYRQTRRLRVILASRDTMDNVPVNLEARRRIAFFGNSLFMRMPRAPLVEKTMAFSVLTPYYNEDVVYGKEQLKSENDDKVSILYYLQTIYADEWANFLQRMRRQGMVSEDELWTTKFRDLRLWASYRGQTLARTVRGMMYYYRALKLLAFLDSASEVDIPEGSGLEMTTLFKGHEHGTALMKFTYVVTCQIYGTHKAKKDPRAEEILYLMKTNEALRVAYVDKLPVGNGTEYYSVLVKYDQQLEKEVEIYRVKLPGPVMLGEGKPENQNHALIFTRGDAVQTIDMNQDNYFEEALKMRNLLEEFRCYHGIRKPNILGVRENIFTGAVSSPAWFMSAQETSFVTLGQRVLANPLKIRLHYGHPDVFDRFWFLTRGGISKASKLINLSEDIFAGFNCTLRGGNVTHHEYIQVGKGRDVGLNHVSMFEAKVASGSGEQLLSRDVYRLGHRLDFFRMLSFFHTTLGFFFNTMMISLTVYVFLWGRLYLALSGVEASLADNANANKAFGTVLNQQFIVQLGLFTALPMIVESTLEQGFFTAVLDFVTMQLQFSSVFFAFSLGTRSHYFGRTILHGGAKYRATGRGFVVHHIGFAENYRLYSRSHFIKAIELGLILTIYAAYSPVAKGTFTYIALTISSWFLVVSWIMAPFVFNPSGFDSPKTTSDYHDFMKWIWFRGSVFAKSEQSWENWWNQEQGDDLRNTSVWGKLAECLLDLRFFFFQYGMVYRLGMAAGSKSIVFYVLSWMYAVVALGTYLIVMYARNKYYVKRHIRYRLVQFLVIILGILIVTSLMVLRQLKFVDISTCLLAFIPSGWGCLSIAQVFRPVLEKTMIWETVISIARLYDIMFGMIVFTPVAVFSWIPGIQTMQNRILFNEAFGRGVCGYSRSLVERNLKLNNDFNFQVKCGTDLMISL